MNTRTYQYCDPTQLLETVGYDREIFTDWVTMFLDESVRQFELVQTAARDGDLKTLEFESHALKGTIGNTGAQKLYEELYAIEQESHGGQNLCTPARMQAMQQELMAVREEMQHFMEHGDFSEPG